MRSPLALFVVVMTLSGSAASIPVSTIPGADVLAALDRLDQPSHALPLAGDRQVGIQRWVHPSACADVALAYQGAGAPVPAESVITPGPRQSLVVDAPYGRTGILLEDQPDRGQCEYGIATSPTVSITGAGLAVEGYFVGVLCSSVLGLNFILAEFDNGGVVTTVEAAPGDELPWQVLIIPGTLEQILAMSGVPPGATQIAGDGTFDGSELAFEGTSATGQVSVRLACTPFTQLPTQG